MKKGPATAKLLGSRSAESRRRRRPSLTASGVWAAFALIGGWLAFAPTTQALTTVNAIAPADGAILPLDQPTSFVIQSADCGTQWWLQASYSPERDPTNSLVNRLPFPVFDKGPWAVDGSGNCMTTWDPRIISYSALPSAGSTLYWQAWRNDAMTLSPVQRLLVAAGSRVSPPSPDEVGITVNEGAIYTNDSDVELTVAAPEFATRSLIANDGGFAGAKAFSISSSGRATYSWKLVSSGPERLPKTVYARFSRSATEPTPICATGPALAAPAGTPASICGIDPTKTFSDDIILDQTAPIIDQVQLNGGSSGGTGKAAASRLSTYHLKLRAHDRTSGVHRMQITNSKARPGKLRKFRKRTTFRGTGSKIFVRVRDHAGNFSRWRRAQASAETAR